jgi:hypothetical protein
VRLSLSTYVSHGPFIPIPGVRQISGIGGVVLGRGGTEVHAEELDPGPLCSLKVIL